MFEATYLESALEVEGGVGTERNPTGHGPNRRFVIRGLRAGAPQQRISKKPHDIPSWVFFRCFMPEEGTAVPPRSSGASSGLVQG